LLSAYYFIGKYLLKLTNGEMAEAIEHLPSKHEAQSSNTSTTKKKKRVIWVTFAVLEVKPMLDKYSTTELHP
jgi:hypothetical protein